MACNGSIAERRTASPLPRHLVLLAAATLLSRARAAAQASPPQPVSPFLIDGYIQAATLGPGTDVFAGGTATVNSQKITIPRNTIDMMPAFLPPHDAWVPHSGESLE